MALLTPTGSVFTQKDMDNLYEMKTTRYMVHSGMTAEHSTVQFMYR